VRGYDINNIGPEMLGTQGSIDSTVKGVNPGAPMAQIHQGKGDLRNPAVQGV
jgi:hypothetical protein